MELGIQAGKSAVDAMQELTNDKGTKYEREEKVGRGWQNITCSHEFIFTATWKTIRSLTSISVTTAECVIGRVPCANLPTKQGYAEQTEHNACEGVSNSNGVRGL